MVISAVGFFVFQYVYFPERYADLRIREMEDVFGEEEFFVDNARSVLDTRSDVGYVRLLDHNGVLEKSFGFQDDEGFEKLTLKGPEEKTVLVGLRISAGKQFNFDALIWSLIFGSLMAVALSVFIHFVSNRSLGFIKEFSDAMKSITRGDYSVRLNESSLLVASSGIKRLYRDFNEMISSLNIVPDTPSEAKLAADSDSVEKSRDEKPFEGSRESKTGFLPKIVVSEHQSSQKDSWEAPDSSVKEEISRVEEISAQEIQESGDSPFSAPKVPYSEKTNTDVCVLVIKIADFEALIEDIPPSEINVLTAEYRKSISSIIVSFGGVLEAMLRDEVVAFFSGPDSDEESVAKLSSVCSAVEIMQFFASKTKEANISSGSRVKPKVGIASSKFFVSEESDIFTLAKPSVKEAKTLCDNARAWNIFVTKDFREGVRDFIEVKRQKIGDDICYAVTGVEESALERFER